MTVSSRADAAQRVASAEAVDRSSKNKGATPGRCVQKYGFSGAFATSFVTEPDPAILAVWMAKIFTETEKDVATVAVGGLAFIAAAVATLWASWSCLDDLRKAIVIVALGCVFLAGLFSVFWNRKTVATVTRKAEAYDRSRSPGHWTAPRVLGFWLIASSKPIVVNDQGTIYSEFALMLRNGAPFDQELTHLRLTEISLLDGNTVLFTDKDVEYHERLNTLPPGEERAVYFKLKLPDFPPGKATIRLHAIVMLSAKSEELGKLVHSRTFVVDGLVSDPRPAIPVGYAVADLNDDVTIHGELPGGKAWQHTIQWRILMNLVLKDLLKPNWEMSLRSDVATALARLAGHEVRYGHEALVKIDEADFTNIRAQMMGRDLVRTGSGVVPNKGAEVVWHCSDTGKQFHVQETLRESQPPKV